MKRSATVLATVLLTAAAVVGADRDKQLLNQIRTRQARVAAVVSYFQKHGIKLMGSRVVEPKAEGYVVIVHFRTFPDDATEKQMHEELAMINLAYMLNVPARVAMSYPSLQSTDPNGKLPKLEDVAVAKKLKKLFMEYRPAPPQLKK
jgi:hypothetical protein